MTETGIKHLELLGKVYKQEYYTRCLPKYILPINAPDTDVISFWNDFWFRLPDSPAIHCPLFYEICDLIEGGENYDPDL